MSSPCISVVISTITVDDRLAEAVNSVLTQSGVDLEVILVLDGLPSATVLPFQGERLRVVALERRHGLAAALNAGIAQARGGLIARLDADDVMLPGRLRAQYDQFSLRSTLVCLGSSTTLIGSDGEHLGFLPRPTGPQVSRLLLRHNVLAHPSVMFRRATFERAGGYNELCPRMQDYELWLRMAHFGELDNLDRPFTAYRIHPGQISRSTPPWGAATPIILRSRRRLARSQGRPLVAQLAVDAIWLASQALRHLKLRRPAYESRVSL